MMLLTRTGFDPVYGDHSVMVRLHCHDAIITDQVHLFSLQLGRVEYKSQMTLGTSMALDTLL